MRCRRGVGKRRKNPRWRTVELELHWVFDTTQPLGHFFDCDVSVATNVCQKYDMTTIL